LPQGAAGARTARGLGRRRTSHDHRKAVRRDPRPDPAEHRPPRRALPRVRHRGAGRHGVRRRRAGDRFRPVAPGLVGPHCRRSARTLPPRLAGQAPGLARCQHADRQDVAPDAGGKRRLRHHAQSVHRGGQSRRAKALAGDLSRQGQDDLHRPTVPRARTSSTRTTSPRAAKTTKPTAASGTRWCLPPARPGQSPDRRVIASSGRGRFALPLEIVRTCATL